jgi:hypothetical protein
MVSPVVKLDPGSEAGMTGQMFSYIAKPCYLYRWRTLHPGAGLPQSAGFVDPALRLHFINLLPGQGPPVVTPPPTPHPSPTEPHP